MNGFVRGNLGTGLGGNTPAKLPERRSDFQMGRGELVGTDSPKDEDSSHLANIHAVGSSPCPADLANFREVQEMGR